uniref:Ripply transcriptional repressor 2 n=1 Tax=Rhinolophus ferrumequinum TaxID=59479 RepID=A0A671DIK1_RHIFE
METAERGESGARECARCSRLLPSVLDRPTRRGGTESGYRSSPLPCTSPTPPLPTAPPQLLPSALRPPTSLGPALGCKCFCRVWAHVSPARLCSPPCRSGGFWRPWVDTRGEQEEEAPHHAVEAMPNGPGMTEASGKLSRYRHPVRLFWPKSKCYDYLYQEAEALLKNFPIQATISFYEDSDSEDEIEELICEN